MLWDDINDWSGNVVVNNKRYPSIADARKSLENSSVNIDSIILCTVNENAIQHDIEQSESVPSVVYKITVRQYMTRPSTPDFDFMSKWNNNIPMPLRTMVGTIEKETTGMVFMKLHGDITSRLTTNCLKCGKKITNPISQFFGMGPECGGHHYVNPFENEEELMQTVAHYRKTYLQKIMWEGWIIKSSILEKEIVNEQTL